MRSHVEICTCRSPDQNPVRTYSTTALRRFVQLMLPQCRELLYTREGTRALLLLINRLISQLNFKEVRNSIQFHIIALKCIFKQANQNQSSFHAGFKNSRVTSSSIGTSANLKHNIKANRLTNIWQLQCYKILLTPGLKIKKRMIAKEITKS